LSLKTGKVNVLLSGHIDDFTLTPGNLYYLSEGQLKSLEGSLTIRLKEPFSRIWYTGRGFLLKRETPDDVSYSLLYRKKLRQLFRFKPISITIQRGNLTYKISLSEPALSMDRNYFYLCDTREYTIKKISLEGKLLLEKRLGPEGKISPLLRRLYGLKSDIPVFGAEKIINGDRHLFILTNIWKNGSRRVDIIDKKNLKIRYSYWFNFPTSYFFASEKYIIYFDPIRKRLKIYRWTKN